MLRNALSRVTVAFGVWRADAICRMKAFITSSLARMGLGRFNTFGVEDPGGHLTRRSSCLATPG